MPRNTLLQITQDLDPDFAVVKNHMKKYARLVADKVVGNTVDPLRYPIADGTLESILKKRFDGRVKTHPRMPPLLRQQKERLKRNVQSKWRRRYTRAGYLRSSESDSLRIFHSGTHGRIHLATAQSVFEQLDNKYLFHDCSDLVKNLEHIAKELDESLPESSEAYNWLGRMVDMDQFRWQPEPLQKSKLELIIRQVKCIELTTGPGDDDIYIGGQKVDNHGNVTKRRKVHVKQFPSDGSVRNYSHPRYMKFADFDLNISDDWPRYYNAMIVLVEEDSGGFGEFINELMAITKSHIADALAAESVALATALAGAMTAALAFVITVFVFLFVFAIIDAICEALEDDVFPPVSVGMLIESPAMANTLDHVSDNRWMNCSFEGHGGEYQITYSIRCT